VAALSGALPDKEAPLLFLCRSGARSAAAAKAMTAAGYSTCLNVADGFEGPLDAQAKRGTAGGWKAAGLPWRQT
jgi:rhodanese-related sulfurtransferase